MGNELFHADGHDESNSRCRNSASETKIAAPHRNSCSISPVLHIGGQTDGKNMANIIGDDYTYVYEYLAHVRSHLNRSSKAFICHLSTANYTAFLFLFNSLYVSRGGYYLHLIRFLCLKPHSETDRLQCQSDPPKQYSVFCNVKYGLVFLRLPSLYSCCIYT
jgi:hypothetical protein